MGAILDGLKNLLELQGYRSRTISASHLSDLQEAIEGKHLQNLFDPNFYQECLSFFQFRAPEDFPKDASIIVVAVPCASTKLGFSRDGKVTYLTIPPTYVGYTNTFQIVGDRIRQYLTPKGYRVAPVKLPLKTLAVQSGLGAYGRNNICYVPGMGSFHQLVAYFIDIPGLEDNWQEASMMEACENCVACIRKCPTQAIQVDRFLLQADRCLVYHNERGPGYPFPEWINPAVHNCLVGCMVCQQVCPVDKPFLNQIDDGGIFSTVETSMLLEGFSAERLPVATLEKLEQLELMDYLEVLPRNLGVLLNPTIG